VNNLREEPKYLRTARSVGTIERVDHRGGYRGQGVIRGVSVITSGEAMGHDLWIDSVMLEQVADSINQKNKGLKSRFTHPSMSGDGLGKFVGRVMDAEVQGDQVVADQHFSQAGHSTPDGDLAGWLMDMAEDDPDAYGLSIVFDVDADAVDEFVGENTEAGLWKSPDPDNKRNLPHARLAEIRAVDSVDEPAANPAGLFHRDSSIAREAEEVARFALGLADDKPVVVQLGLDADRVRGFVQRFLETNQLRVIEMAEVTEERKDNESDIQSTPDSEAAVAEQSDEETLNPEEETQKNESLEPETVCASGGRGEARRFLDEFGTAGAVWFAEGREFEDCRSLETTELRREVEELRAKLSASVPQGEHEPIDFDSDEATPKRGFASKIQVK